MSSNKWWYQGSFIFFHEKISHTKKHEKHKTQISNFHSDVFYTHKKPKKYKTQTSDFHLNVLYAHKKYKKHKKHKKHKKSQNVKHATFFLLDVFMRIKMLPFLFYTQKAQKAHKKHKNKNKRISDYFPLRCFLGAFFIFVRL